VVVCRGNHDFTDIGPYFGGDVHEIGIDPKPVFEIGGLRFGGMRGIPYMIGEWSDELHDAEWDWRVEHLPDDLDVLVTHTPPHGILDSGGSHYGCRAIRRYVDRRMDETAYRGGKPLRAHLFGHVHERHGFHRFGDRGTIFSNAATTVKELDL
jgi:Icc-related predicted phosphoesterase